MGKMTLDIFTFHAYILFSNNLLSRLQKNSNKIVIESKIYLLYLVGAPAKTKCVLSF